VSDGLSKTLAFGEVATLGSVTDQGWCQNIASGTHGFSTKMRINSVLATSGQRSVSTITRNHPGGAGAVFADGAVRFFQGTIDFEIFNWL
jgi:prepilin-type processing-associated H-X9-DG protein